MLVTLHNKARGSPLRVADVTTMMAACVRLMILVILIRATPAHADGGTVQFQRKAGSYIVTVFTSSNPVRVGTEDVSVMIQNLDNPHPLLDGEVLVTVNQEDGPGIATRATREQAQNKLLYAAVV